MTVASLPVEGKDLQNCTPPLQKRKWMQLGTGSHSQQMVRVFTYHPSLSQSLWTGTNKNRVTSSLGLGQRLIIQLIFFSKSQQDGPSIGGGKKYCLKKLKSEILTRRTKLLGIMVTCPFKFSWSWKLIFIFGVMSPMIFLSLFTRLLNWDEVRN